MSTIQVATKIMGERRVHVVATAGDRRVAFEVDYNPRLPSGHPMRYAGLPSFSPPVRDLLKVAVRSALAS